MTDRYEVYSPQGDTVPAQQESPPAQNRAAPWQVVIEYSNKGDAKPPTVIRVIGDRHDDRAVALAEAERQAFGYQPPDPFSPQRRTIFRDGPDGYLVIIQGAMSTFHMSVRIVQQVGVA